MTDPCASLDEQIHRFPARHPRCDPRTRLTAPSRDPKVDEEQRPMLHVEPATQLDVLDERAIADDRVGPSLARQARLARFEEAPRHTLEEARRWRQRKLNEHRFAARGHRREQPVHRRLALVLEALQGLGALDELGALLQAQHAVKLHRTRRRRPQRAVDIGDTDRRLDHRDTIEWTADRDPCGTRTMIARAIAIRRALEMDLESPPRLPA